jgi:N-acyl-D-amino-acid deacylase
MVTHSGPGDLESPGCTIEELAKRRDCAPEVVTLNLYESFGNAVQVAMFYRLESDMVEFLRHPLSTIGSDGIALPASSLGSKPHPRFFGTFPRVLGRYARDQSVMSLVAAIRKMTGEPADRLGLADVGYLRKGFAADVVAIRADAVGDRATFSQSNLLSSGIRFVVVNGEVVWEEDRWTGARPGRVLVRGEAAA